MRANPLAPSCFAWHVVAASGSTPRVAVLAHERHGLGVLVCRAWAPNGRVCRRRGRVTRACRRRHHRLSSLGATPASCACAAVTMPYPSAAMSYMSSKCVMSKPWHICIGFDNAGFFLEGNPFRVKPLETIGVVALCPHGPCKSNRSIMRSMATIHRRAIA